MLYHFVFLVFIIPTKETSDEERHNEFMAQTKT